MCTYEHFIPNGDALLASISLMMHRSNDYFAQKMHKLREKHKVYAELVIVCKHMSQVGSSQSASGCLPGHSVIVLVLDSL